MRNIPSLIVLTLLVLCAGLSFVQVSLILKQEELSDSTNALWTFFWIVLVGTWVLRDYKSGNFEKPFDFGLFLYLFLPLLLPYYLVRTRGIEGVVTFLGFVAIYNLPFFVGLVAYAYYT